MMEGVELRFASRRKAKGLAKRLISAAVGWQLGKLGSEITRKNLGIQPTIKIPLGSQCNGLLNKEILFQARQVIAEL